MGDRKKITVVIPVLHEADRIGELIDGLRNMSSDDPVEIIVVDGAEERDTLAAIGRHDVRKMASRRGRGIQMNRGASAARGGILLFLHADTSLPEQGLRDIERVMERDCCIGGAFDLGIDSRHWCLKVAEKVGSLRSRITRLPYGDQAIFIRKEFFSRIGGYRDIPLMEDVDLMQRVKRAGGRICFIPNRVSTSARRWERDGAVRGTLRNWALVSLFLLGVPPERLSRFYGD